MSNLASIISGRAPRAVRSYLCAASVLAAAAACGGGGDGGGGIVNPGGSTATFPVAAQFVLAPTTTSGLTLRTTASYELAAGGTKPLDVVTTTVASTSAQTLTPVVNITSCLNDPARTGGAQSASCRVVVEYALVAGGRVVDAQTVGAQSVTKGTSAAPQSVTFIEVTGVRVTNAGGTVLADAAAVRAELGQAVTLTATALRADNAAAAGRAVAWTSDNAAVATVNPTTGVITPVAAGQARVTAAVGEVRSSVVVTVVPAPAALTVTVAGGTGSGTVTSSPGGLNCRVTAGAAGGTCSGSVPSDAAVTLTATPDAGTAFGGWAGDCAGAGTNLQCVLAASGGAARSVGVRFNAQRTLTVALAGTGTGSVASQPAGITCSATGTPGCTSTYNDGTSVTLTATPGAGSTFTGWTGACTGTGTCTVTLSQATSVTATFSGTPRPTPFNVTVVSSTGATYEIDLIYERILNGTQNNSGLFTFVLSTANAAPQFTLQADEGTPVTLTIRPKGAYRILSWGGVCAGTPVGTPNASCTFTQTPNAAVTVNLGP